jgi:hypothetical protein
VPQFPKLDMIEQRRQTFVLSVSIIFPYSFSNGKKHSSKMDHSFVLSSFVAADNCNGGSPMTRAGRPSRVHKENKKAKANCHNKSSSEVYHSHPH